jgi:hypothetical protein
MLMTRSNETGLQRDAAGLMSVLFMSVTNMAPGAAVAFSARRQVQVSRIASCLPPALRLASPNRKPDGSRRSGQVR